ncbi:MAG: hypothetical protein E5Y64_31275 [Mesorhizobium sp.]|nr:MAG: hypothetical protein E5Y64_31275 [Mesorhizobium sp.]
MVWLETMMEETFDLLGIKARSSLPDSPAACRRRVIGVLAMWISDSLFEFIVRKFKPVAEK